VGITAGSREVPGRNACDRRHAYCIIIIIIITDKQNKYQELANEICAMWKQKGSTNDPDSNIICGSNSKV